MLAIVVLFIVIQLIPRQQNHRRNVVSDITKIYQVPGNVQAIFKNSCYDCHSNRTNYPWYAQIQPFRYILDSHIKEGKADLNFNDFGTYSKRKQKSKLRAIANSLTEGTMPLSSYLFIHHDAMLSTKDKSLIQLMGQ
ncbi:MAG: Cytochrome [Mucilaginibacter sp.]|nr:Cytochrome [Mucilaginibacter sp.]